MSKLWTQLDKIWKKQRYLGKTTHNLLEEAVPSKEMPKKEKKSGSEEKSEKKTQNQTFGEKLKYKLFL